MVVGNLDYDSNINPQYNTLAIYESIQSAIKSFIDRFISVSPLSSPSFKAPHHLFFSLRPQIRAEQERQGHLGLLLLRRLSRLGVQSAVRSQRSARFFLSLIARHQRKATQHERVRAAGGPGPALSLPDLFLREVVHSSVHAAGQSFAFSFVLSRRVAESHVASHRQISQENRRAAGRRQHGIPHDALQLPQRTRRERSRARTARQSRVDRAVRRVDSRIIHRERRRREATQRGVNRSR